MAVLLCQSQGAPKAGRAETVTGNNRWANIVYIEIIPNLHARSRDIFLE